MGILPAKLYWGSRPESSQEKPQNCNEKTQLGSQIKYCGFSSEFKGVLFH
jgi:hypothetical protein